MTMWKQLWLEIPLSCSGRCAARSDALQSRGQSINERRGLLDPGSAQQRSALQRVRDTRASPPAV